MDHSGGSAPRRAPSSHAPPPLALSDFLAQQAPRSSESPSDGAGAVLNPEALNAELLRIQSQEDIKQPNPPPQTPQPKTAEPPRPPSTPRDPPPNDWLATRLQLLPRKNQGSRADWIRGWSEEVSIHGEETYCACSVTAESSSARRGRSLELRAILQRAGSPANNNKKKPSSEPEICRHCSRPSSPPPGSVASDKPDSLQSRGFGKRVSELLMRVRPRQSRSAHNSPRKKRGDADLDVHPFAWPEDLQPRWAMSGPKRSLGPTAAAVTRPSSQPLQSQQQKSGSVDMLGNGHHYLSRLHHRPRQHHSHHRHHHSTLGAKITGRIRSSPSSSGSGLGDLDALSDSDDDREAPPRGAAGLSRSISRLQRAAALLHRSAARPGE
ncbi:hypothetical protein VTK26DRAFT_4918 [Humicola hyalothermophila]